MCLLSRVVVSFHNCILAVQYIDGIFVLNSLCSVSVVSFHYIFHNSALEFHYIFHNSAFGCGKHL